MDSFLSKGTEVWVQIPVLTSSQLLSAGFIPVINFFICVLLMQVERRDDPEITKHDVSGLDAFYQTDTRWQSNQGLQVPQERQGPVLTAALICLRSENHKMKVFLLTCVTSRL